MIADVLMPDEEGVGYYNVHNPELTLNDQGWTGAIAGNRHLEGRRNLDMDRSDHILFEMLWSGMTNPRPNVDAPCDASTLAIRYSSVMVERMWSMVDRSNARVRRLFMFFVLLKTKQLSSRWIVWNMRLWRGKLISCRSTAWLPT